jgi:hypothetical protein
MNEKPIFNYSLRTPDGGWLWQLSVSRNGTPFQVLDWNGVAAHLDQYQLHPKLIRDESAAWVGPQNIAVLWQSLLSQQHGIETEIVERS